MIQEQDFSNETAQSITEEEFRKIRELLHSGFGIKLTEEKRALVVGRLQKLLREKGGIDIRRNSAEFDLPYGIAAYAKVYRELEGA